MRVTTRRELITPGSVAVITGASSGIGAEFARQLGALGANLVLVARRRDALESLAAELRSAYGVAVDVLVTDLSTPDAARRLLAAVAELGHDVDILVDNAGFGVFGDVIRTAPERLEAEVAVNVAAVSSLSTRVLPSMMSRGHGILINVASNAAFQATPHMAVYAATKAFVLSLTRALWKEAEGTGVRVLALCPGPTQTAFFDVAGDGAQVGRRRTAAQVVESAFRALERGKPSVVDGFTNALVARVGTRFAPERLLLWGAERVVRPRA